MPEAPAAIAPVIQTVAIIGAGRLGRRFALDCAAAGFHVVLEDVMPANLRRAQDDYAALAPTHGTLATALTVEDAVAQADLAIDFVPDELESKLEIFSLLDRMAPPRTILLTPTETLSITDLASCVYRPDRCFALAGDLLTGTPLRLLHPPASSPTSLDATLIFLRHLDRIVSSQADPQAPMLMQRHAIAVPPLGHKPSSR